jgi:branched-chain amino acid transport system permease protein
MLEQLPQFLISGITVGSTYALIALGFTIIYNSSNVVNFAQGEFVMIGAMSTIFISSSGVPFFFAILAGIAITILTGLALEKFAIEPAKGASVVTTIIITIGASIFFRGVALLIWGKNIHALPHFSGETPISLGPATIIPQNLWVMGGALIVVLFVRYFFEHTLLGKAMLASSDNRNAALLMGINVKKMLLISYGLSAGLGAVAGVLVTPITYTSYDSGVMLGLKGFSASILGGMGNSMGAVLGGLILGIMESLGAGLISSSYKDAFSFLLILSILFLKPSGLFGAKEIERV